MKTLFIVLGVLAGIALLLWIVNQMKGSGTKAPAQNPTIKIPKEIEIGIPVPANSIT